MLNITQEDREKLDMFCRHYLLECIKKSKNSHNQELHHFVEHDASYEDVLLMVYEKTFTPQIQEANYDMDLRVRQAERSMAPMLKLGAAIIAGGVARNMIGSYLGAGIGSSIAAGAILGPGMAFGLAALGKLIKFGVMKFFNKCSKGCDSRIPEDEEHKGTKRKLCTTNCRLEGINQQITYLRAELGKCRYTANPEKCASSLMKKIGQLNGMQKKQEMKLAKYEQELKFKESMPI